MNPTHDDVAPSAPVPGSPTNPVDAGAQPNESSSTTATSGPADPFFVSAPQVSLPKGGGAIHGMGEKFTANPVTGTASFTVPIATSPGRSGFGPTLTLAYDSGNGNSVYGFGWSLDTPQITRKTSKGLPRYIDGGIGTDPESDVFLLSGAEDLVPILTGNATIDVDAITHPGFVIRRYRPRIDTLYARIERWTRTDDPDDVHWRSITKDNILTIYGLDDNSRIAEPLTAADPGGPPPGRRRIFNWLISQTRDDRGNAIIYHYKPDDTQGFPLRPDGRNIDGAHESCRGDIKDKRRTNSRYLKRILYGNRVPLLDNATGTRPTFLPAGVDPKWMFELVVDYGEHNQPAPTPDDSAGSWPVRGDAFSTYRPGFEVRTTRLAQRFLMFHHFPNDADVGMNCLVRSTDLIHTDTATGYAFLASVTHTGYRRTGDSYRSASLPPVEYTYSQPVIDPTVHTLNRDDLKNLPIGVDGTQYQFVDLHAEGLPGILTRTPTGWWYQRNISPISARDVEFDPIEAVRTIPAAPATAQLVDLGGDGHLDLVDFDSPLAGAYEHDTSEGWNPLRPFKTRPTMSPGTPGIRLVDLDGDGLADLMTTADDTLEYYPSRGVDGFGPATTIPLAVDENRGPTREFINDHESVHLADMSGDGLSDVVRIRNGEICYWPNLGYGHFGDKIVMDNAPRLADDTAYTPGSVLLADIDGTGTTDLIYLHPGGPRLYFNQSGNAWSSVTELPCYPALDDAAAVTTADLRGRGTACLLWSSPHGADTARQMRYVDLMGGTKPHLLIASDNNLGAQMRVTYTTSTEFYLSDKRAGTPWSTRLAFPVHVVAQIDTYDWIGRNRFTTLRAYHDGGYDGVEREFRGFRMVEQWDTDQYGAFTATGDLPAAENTRPEAFVPPVHTKTWFHTGMWLGADDLAADYAGNGTNNAAAPPAQYWRPAATTDAEARNLLLTDPPLPAGLSLAEQREATRALKGLMLRQEVFADDAGPNATDEQRARADRPYTVTQHTYQVRLQQHTGPNQHAVFDTIAAQTLTYHYERAATDPRVQHAITLEVDPYGNVRKQVAIGYGRDASPLDNEFDQNAQTTTLITATDSLFTAALTDPRTFPNDHRTPLPAETRTLEFTGFGNRAARPNGRFEPTDFLAAAPPGGSVTFVPTASLHYEQDAPDDGQHRSRVIEHVRTFYRPDDFGAAAGTALALLPLGKLQPRALAGESYKLAFTKGLLDTVFVRDGEDLFNGNPAAVLGGVGPDQGGYRSSTDLKTAGLFPPSDDDGDWWIPSGRVFLSPDRADANPAVEATAAAANFFLSHRFRTPFHAETAPTETVIAYDNTAGDGWAINNLLAVDVRQPSAVDGVPGNRVSAAERAADGTIGPWRVDYRVLQPAMVSDVNRNRTQVAFDTLGMVVGAAVMGKPAPEPVEGDNLTGFEPDLTATQLASLFDDPNPYQGALALLADASTRVAYDVHRFSRTRQTNAGNPELWQPAGVVTLARETHATDPLPPGGLRIQLAYSYSDGDGREIQKKIGAEKGPVSDGGPDVDPRWVASGWTILNNKGQPVRQYEPFFTAFCAFEYGNTVGVSPVLFYDPLGRVIATLNPDNTYTKVLFDRWKQTTFDTIDTCGLINTNDPTAQRGDPRIDPDIAGLVADYFTHLPNTATWQTWYTPRAAGLLGPRDVDAAARSAAYSNTPTTVHFDTLGRPFRTDIINRVVCPGHLDDGKPDDTLSNRLVLDIEGNQRTVRDADQQGADPLGRIVMRYDYTMLGTRIHQQSMEAGQRWTLADITGKVLFAWDSRGHTHATQYDRLRRPIAVTVHGSTPDSDPRTLNTTIQVERIDYGDTHTDFTPDVVNLRGQSYQHYGSAGLVTNAQLDPTGKPVAAYDFKGNLLRTTRRLATDYKSIPDWSANPALDDEYFQSQTSFDALNRIIQTVAPHSNQPQATVNVTQPCYSPAGLLDALDVWLDTTEPAELLNPAATPPTGGVGVNFIGYDAKGQRQRIDYKNTATTRYWYDPNTFRLTHLYTHRGPTFTDDCDNPSPPPARIAAPDDPPAGVHCGIQNLTYAYDASGNITHVRDDAQQLVFFRNQVVEPSNDYTYDATYRLIKATGREHIGQKGGAPIPYSPSDAGRIGLLHPGDGYAMDTYTEGYVYDAVGNFVQMQHRGSAPSQPGWTREYGYAAASLTEPGKQSNRLTSTQVIGGNAAAHETYLHDAHGNTLRMPHLGGGGPEPNMHWDFKDQLRQVDMGGGGAAFYVYDPSGHRVRKVWEKSPGLTEERIYDGDFEVFRKHDGPIGGNPVTLERETLHVMDDNRRLGLVETRTADRAGNDLAPQQLVRCQCTNHLGSASLELDQQAQIISYEEYAPFGSSTYQAVRSRTETPKRYRYTGKERDDETGLSYYEARHYSPWLGRWTSVDPKVNRDLLHADPAAYTYVRNNPTCLVDPTGNDATATTVTLGPATQAILRGMSKGPTPSLRFTSSKGMTATWWAKPFVDWFARKSGRDPNETFVQRKVRDDLTKLDLFDRPSGALKSGITIMGSLAPLLNATQQLAPQQDERSGQAAKEGEQDRDQYIYFYHATTKSMATGIRKNGIDLEKTARRDNPGGEPNENLDFGPGYYTTTSKEQALAWANRYRGDGEVLVYKVPVSDLQKEDLSVLGFEGPTPQWEQFVKAGRKGELTVKPIFSSDYNKLQSWFDVVEGPMYMNPAAPDQPARAGGQQTAWVSQRATQFLNQYLQKEPLR